MGTDCGAFQMKRSAAIVGLLLAIGAVFIFLGQGIIHNGLGWGIAGTLFFAAIIVADDAILKVPAKASSFVQKQEQGASPNSESRERRGSSMSVSYPPFETPPPETKWRPRRHIPPARTPPPDLESLKRKYPLDVKDAAALLGGEKNLADALHREWERKPTKSAVSLLHLIIYQMQNRYSTGTDVPRRISHHPVEPDPSNSSWDFYSPDVYRDPPDSDRRGKGSRR